MVGPTGAGKRSIAKLVGRTLRPDAGAVLADGVDLRTYEIGSYRSRLGIVPQDAFCFRGTVASNIAYGKPGRNARGDRGRRPRRRCARDADVGPRRRSTASSRKRDATSPPRSAR